jgi:hypothetical protein
MSEHRPEYGAIDLLKEPESILADTIGHEYDHYVVHNMLRIGNFEMDSPNKSCKIIKEGHASSVGSHVATNYFSRNKNPEYNIPNLKMKLAQLSMAYEWLCLVNNLPIKNEVLGNNYIPYWDGQINDFRTNRPNSYVLGPTLFYLAEAKLGNGIYADFVNGDFGFINKAFGA